MKYNNPVKYLVFISLFLFTFFAAPLLQGQDLQHYPSSAKFHQHQGLEYFVITSNNTEESLIAEEEMGDGRVVLPEGDIQSNDFIARFLADICKNFTYKTFASFINLYIDSPRGPPFSLV